MQAVTSEPHHRPDFRSGRNDGNIAINASSFSNRCVDGVDMVPTYHQGSAAVASTLLGALLEGTYYQRLGRRWRCRPARVCDLLDVRTPYRRGPNRRRSSYTIVCDDRCRFGRLNRPYAPYRTLVPSLMHVAENHAVGRRWRVQ